MKNIDSELLRAASGKNIGLVYSHRADPNFSKKHYAFWKMDVVSDWALAVEALGAIPLLLDVKSFISKAVNGELGDIDYIVNLNAGNNDLGNLGIVPSICSYISTPCIPCNTSQVITGENKIVSNHIASSLKMNLPKSCLGDESQTKIARPLNLGSSVGVTLNPKDLIGEDWIIQDFIPGFDLTTPLIFNPVSNQMEVLPSVIYDPENKNVNWFLGNPEKETHSGYQKRLCEVDAKTKQMFKLMVKSYGIKTFCRIDCRVRSLDYREIDGLINEPIPFSRIYFLEINPMPTISEGINFCLSVQGISQKSSLRGLLDKYNQKIGNERTAGFILLCSLLGLESQVRAKH